MPPQPTWKRSRTGCRTCRARKVKCDERSGGCMNCEKLSLPCSALGAPTNSLSRTLQSSPTSSFRSCTGCRDAKVRCTGDRPVCQRCRRRQLDCAYGKKTAPKWMTKTQDQHVTLDSGATTSTELDANLEDAGASTLPQLHVAVGSTCVRQSNEAHLAQHGSAEKPLRRDAKTHDIAPLNSNAEELAWSFRATLPDTQTVMLLVEEYFHHIHPLRSFGFLHKPSFMLHLEDQPCTRYDEDPLLLVICALGVKSFLIRSRAFESRDAQLVLKAGNQWSCQAMYLLVSGLSKPSIELAMCAVLLHEFKLRIGDYASAFMITGLATRLAQGLQVNLETLETYPSTPATSMAFVESRRRLMWSIYIMDAWVGSGVDQLTQIREADIKIQLPCSEQHFIMEVSTCEESFTSQDSIESVGLCEIPDLAAQFVRLTRIRKQVLRFVKNLEGTRSPWSQDSEFEELRHSLHSWCNGLPPHLRYTRASIQKCKVTHQHGALLLLHITYHQTICDLTRIGMPDLFKIKTSYQFPKEQQNFLEGIQDSCFDNCLAVSKVFEDALKYGIECLADTWLCVVAHDVLRVMIHYVNNRLGSVDRHENGGASSIVEEALSTNTRALKRMIPLFAPAEQLHSALYKMGKEAGFAMQSQTSLGSTVDPTDPATGTSIHRHKVFPKGAPEADLNPLAIYCLARNDIRSNGTSTPYAHAHDAMDSHTAVLQSRACSVTPRASDRESTSGDQRLADSPLTHHASLDRIDQNDKSEAELSFATSLNNWTGHELMFSHHTPETHGTSAITMGDSSIDFFDIGAFGALDAFPATHSFTF